MSEKKKVRKPRKHPTEKQLNFAHEYIENGGNATLAYQKVYDTNTDNMSVVRVNAHKVLRNDNVSIIIKEIRLARYTDNILTLQERKKILSGLGAEGDTRAIDLLNKMEAVYDDKADVNVNVFERPVIKKLTNDDIEKLRKDLKEK